MIHPMTREEAFRKAEASYYNKLDSHDCKYGSCKECLSLKFRLGELQEIAEREGWIMKYEMSQEELKDLELYY